MNFPIEETTIGDVQAAYASGSLTATELVAAYLHRISAIDKSGPTINSVVSLNPKALEAAEALDAEFARTNR
jgi:Asp-tRNA(Asn)/Glu-tRNA(Gln) amidotransferase A subunit family amidase